MWIAFALQKLLTFFFGKNFQHVWVSLDVNFNKSLTNDIISFEQLGPYYFLCDFIWQRGHFNNIPNQNHMPVSEFCNAMYRGCNIFCVYVVSPD